MRLCFCGRAARGFAWHDFSRTPFDRPPPIQTCSMKCLNIATRRKGQMKANIDEQRAIAAAIRFLRFKRWLDQLDEDAGPIEAIYFEEVRRHAGTDAAHVYGGLLGILTAWCEERLVAYQGVPVGTIKRFATGKGNADKAAVIDAVRQRGFAPADDNEADAIAILLWAVETRGGVR